MHWGCVAGLGVVVGGGEGWMPTNVATLMSRTAVQFMMFKNSYLVLEGRPYFIGT